MKKHWVRAALAFTTGLVALGCTDVTFDGGSRVSDRDIISGRPDDYFEELFRIHASVISKDPYLTPIEEAIEGHIGFRIDALGTATGRVNGRARRVNTAGQLEAVNFSAMTDVGSVGVRSLIDEAKALCDAKTAGNGDLLSGVVSLDDDACHDIEDLADKLDDASDFLDALTFRFQDVDLTWDAPDAEIDKCATREFEDGLISNAPCSTVADCKNFFYGVSGEECRAGVCAFKLACNNNKDCTRFDGSVKFDGDEEVEICKNKQCTVVRPRVCRSADAPPILNARIRLGVEEDQVILEPLLADLRWEQLTGDYRIHPRLCDTVTNGVGDCDTPPGPIFTPDPQGAITGDSLSMSALDIEARAVLRSDDLRVVPNEISAAVCTALFAIPIVGPALAATCFTPIAIAVTLASDQVDDAPAKVVKGFGSLLNTLFQARRLILQLEPTDVMNLTTMIAAQCNTLPTGPMQMQCQMGAGVFNDYVAAVLNRPINLGRTLITIGNSTNPVRLGGDDGTWTASTIQAIRLGAKLVSTEIDPSPLASMCNNVATLCVGTNQPPGCLFCQTAGCGGPFPLPVCATAFAPIVLPAPMPTGMMPAPLLQARPALAQVAQLIPAMSSGIRQIITGPIPSSSFYSKAIMCGATDDKRHPDCTDDMDGAIFYTIRDSDGDTIEDRNDNCPLVANLEQFDDDGDGVGNLCDRCVFIAGANAICDCDHDRDGCNNEGGFKGNNGQIVQCNPSFGGTTFDENPTLASPSRNSPGAPSCGSSSVPRDCDPDDDDDGILDNEGRTCGTGETHCSDNCPCTANADQKESDQFSDTDCGLRLQHGGDACDPISGVLKSPRFLDWLCVGLDVRVLNQPGPFHLPIPGFRPEVCSRFATRVGPTENPVFLPLNPGQCLGPFGGLADPLCVLPRLCPGRGNPPRPNEAIFAFGPAFDRPFWTRDVVSLGLTGAYGPAIGTVRDLDLDRQLEPVVSIPLADSCIHGNCRARAGAIAALGSAGGSKVWTFSTNEASAEFGTAIAGCGDDTLYVSAPKALDSAGRITGAVYELDTSPSAPVIRRKVAGQIDGERFGQSLAVMCEEGQTAAVFAGAPLATKNLPEAGRVYAMTPGGDTFAIYEGSVPNGNLGTAVAVVPRDPLSEEPGAVLATMPNAFNAAGGVVSFDLTGNVRGMLRGQQSGAALGLSVVALDFDGNGTPEVAVGEPYANAGKGRIRITDVNLRQVTAMEGFDGSNMGYRMSLAGDLDGDGAADLTADLQNMQSFGRYVSFGKRSETLPPPGQPPRGGPWPMFRGDPAHTGRATSLGPTSSATRWATSLGSAVLSSPAIATDGTAYVVTGGRLRALAPNGTTRWSRAAYSLAPTSPAIGPDGTVYAAGIAGELLAVAPATGNVLWSRGSIGALVDSPTVDTDGAIYFGDTAGAVTALNPDGTQRWRYQTLGFIRSSPAVARDGTVYIPAFNDKVYAVTPIGTLRWMRSFGLFGLNVASPAIGTDGTVYVGSIDGKLFALDEVTGDTIWSFPAVGEISSPAIGPDGTIYVGSNAGKLYALDRNGVQKWTFATGGRVSSSPAVDGAGRIYVGSDDDRIYAVSSTGTLVFSLRTNGDVRSSPALTATGGLIVGSSDGKLYSLGSP